MNHGYYPENVVLYNSLNPVGSAPENQIPEGFELPDYPLSFNKLAIESSNFIWTTRIFKIVEKPV